MIERMSGTDALLWHMERPQTLMHTMKTVVVDPSQRGAPVTLADLERGIGGVVGRAAHLSLRVRTAPSFPARPFWVTDPDFAVADHLGEMVAEAPGDRAALDAVHSALASTPLDRNRPLWTITLVHGLEGGRQAIVTCIHHSVVDGGAALNGLLMMTAPAPGEKLPPTDPPKGERVSDGQLRRRVLREMPGLLRGVAPLVRDTFASSKRARAYRRDNRDLPSFAGAPRNFTNATIDDSRVCASIDLPLDRMKRIAKATDTTINGVYHALIAAALRDELKERGEALGPVMASFGIAADDGDPLRVSGNRVTPTTVRVYSELEDPVERLRETARSCREGVELRRATGVDLTGRWATYTCRLTAAFLHHGGKHLRRVNSHVVTANVRGPDHRRWSGGLEIVDWISFAVVAYPCNINITAHSYADHMSVGLLVGHGVLSQPRKFLERMASELGALDRELNLQREPIDEGASS